MMVTGVADQERDLLREATEWFARFDAEDFTDEERRRLESWRRRSPEHDEAFERICRTWEAADLAVALGSVPPADVQERPRSSIGPRTWWAVAATLLLVAGCWSFSSHVFLTLRADYATATGEQRTIHLPDRSSVVLNTNTALVSHVEGAHRLVRLLKGEALFQVQADATRPFIVEHAGHRVRVLGTEFVVREQQETTTITVIHGTVQVTGANPSSSPIHLTAGQRVSIGADGAGPVSHVTAARCHGLDAPASRGLRSAALGSHRGNATVSFRLHRNLESVGSRDSSHRHLRSHQHSRHDDGARQHAADSHGSADRPVNCSSLKEKNFLCFPEPPFPIRYTYKRAYRDEPLRVACAHSERIIELLDRW
jgi:transmembrane sensor